MKKRKLTLEELKIKSFTTDEEKSVKAGRAPLVDPETGGTIPTWDAETCNSAIELNCQYTNNNEVGCV